ncbi:92366624-0a68-4619-883b-c84b556f4f16 [Sclerotinia trifoliorum]|uniref:92366624-0a68-4619-883b-c84b556f4f16 n=1 Tax=Sclerotinia trifoliorum TaxID=28548 RepID=A0A8H2ZVD5_9HELO|nr:92366624-0a68-4619-883b-c84b556f4f16 [Sclerotinia trifoliorum]
MANDTYLTDDYVANLLAQDAKASSIKYSSMGLEAYAKESKPPPNKPKPNTRFLRNIIRDTDNHNSALLAKEAAEARARLEGLSNGGRERKVESKVAPGDIRRRQLGDIKAILGGPVKRKREDSGRKRKEDCVQREDGVENTKSKIEGWEGSDRRSRRKDIDISAELIGHRRENRDVRKGRRDEELDAKRRSTSEDKERTKDDRRRHRERSRSPREHRSKESSYRERDRSPRRNRKRSLSPTSEGEEISTHKPHKHSSSRAKQHPDREPEQSSDSDPLDSIIGPRPAHEKQPLRIRGRGATSLGSTSIMDSRFHADYDPKSDVQLEDTIQGEGEDWDQALEALRDRQKWKTQGANRLRDAGFRKRKLGDWRRGRGC